MKYYLSFLCILVMVLFPSTSVMAQEEESQEIFTVQDAFLPFHTHPLSAYRSASGKPTKDYWQNVANYEINTSLNTYEHRINTTMIITYINNSPDDLEYVWVQLDQNLFNPSARGAKTTPVSGSRFGNLGFQGGYNLEKISIEKDGETYAPQRHLVDTNIRLDLRDDLKSKGDMLKIHITYSFNIPPYGSDRMGRIETEFGWIYQLAQWYPRMVVYDDIQGWNVRPYLGAGEFYLEYGTFDVRITAPSNHVVVGSGELMNPNEVLSAKQLSRWQKASRSDKTVLLKTLEEVQNEAMMNVRDKKTWHYRIENSRDFAWASSKAFIWDAARINLSNRKTAMAISVYPKESADKTDWERSTEYTKASVEYYSSKWYEYPYPTAVNVAGGVYGMEYPGVSFCSWESTEADLWGVTDHEFGHNWFPMIVGSNEREYAWMDEGFNTFMNHYSTHAFNNGEYKESSYLNTQRYPVGFMLYPGQEAIMTLPDQVQSNALGMVAYIMPGAGLVILRESILGPERFDEAFTHYIKHWAYKHPTPNDFFNIMENVAGEDLDWFWRGWFEQAWKFDQSVQKIEYHEEEYSKGALITFGNHQKMVFPVHATVIEENGKIHDIELPVEIWHRANEWTVLAPTTSPIKEVILDPDMRFPDIDRVNNQWKHAEDKDE